MENGLFCFKLKSHPHLLLADHLTGVIEIIAKLFSEKTFHWQNESEQQLFSDLLWIAGCVVAA